MIQPTVFHRKKMSYIIGYSFLIYSVGSRDDILQTSYDHLTITF